MTESKLEKLFSEMTLKEKIGQLIQLESGCFASEQSAVTGPAAKLGIDQEMISNSGSVLNAFGAEKIYQIQKKYMEESRLGIPLLFMNDVIYGYHTIFPIPLGLGATWNSELIQEDFREIAKEAASDGIMVTFSPPADLIRDARWGRCLEMASEDPCLLSRYASAMVTGLHNDGKKGECLAACVKHFAGYSAVEAGREYNSVDMGERMLRENYFPAYKAAVESGCELVMTGFNTINGIPATGNQWLVKEVLRKEWGFDGIVISDYAAVEELITHGVAENEEQAAKMAIEATVDIDMQSSCYALWLEKMAENGKIAEQQVNDACWRILCLKNRLGLFENPYYGCNKLSDKESSEEKRICLARESAEKSCVLLKNDGVLPLKKEQKVALIGPYADSRDITGLWAVFADREKTVTLKKAMKEYAGESRIAYAKGCDFLDEYSNLGNFGNIKADSIPKLTEEEAKIAEMEAVDLAAISDVVVMAAGEHILQSGEAGSRTDISLPEVQKKLLKKLRKTGKKIVLVLFNGRPMALNDIQDDCDAILEAWFPGTEGGHAISRILYGVTNPSGRLSVSFPYSAGQEPLSYLRFSTGRPPQENNERFTSRYLDCPNEALFPFGYGLSYHSSNLKNLRLDKKMLKAGEHIQVEAEITNTGTVAGTETIQLYIRDICGSVVRPVLELKDFRQISLSPGETKIISFQITEEMLRFWRSDMSYGSEPGKFYVFIGLNSRDLLKEEFELL